MRGAKGQFRSDGWPKAQDSGRPAEVTPRLSCVIGGHVTVGQAHREKHYPARRSLLRHLAILGALSLIQPSAAQSGNSQSGASQSGAAQSAASEASAFQASDPVNAPPRGADGSEAPAPAILFALFGSDAEKGDVQVFNGTRPERGDWSSVAIAQGCTATFVGRNTILTAAHCVVVGTRRTPSPVEIAGVTFACTADPAYLGVSPGFVGVRHPADYALCTAAPGAPRPAAFDKVRWDRIDLRSIKPGDPLLIAGYGCVTWNFNAPLRELVQGPRQNVIAVGNFTVDALLADSFTAQSDGITQPALCAGDSGGPAFHGISVDQLLGARTIRGIASRNEVNGARVTSHFALLSTPRFRTFVECWMGANPGQHILVEADASHPLAARTC